MSRFHLTVSNPRWGHDDTYRLDVDDNGWVIAHIAINGNCDPTGEPYLYENFRQDGIVYPGIFGWYMRELWEYAHNNSLPDEVIQQRLDRLARWVAELTSVQTPEF